MVINKIISKITLMSQNVNPNFNIHYNHQKVKFSYGIVIYRNNFSLIAYCATDTKKERYYS